MSLNFTVELTGENAKKIKDNIRPNKQKICVFPVTCFLKLGYVGRIIIIFLNNLFAWSTFFYKSRTDISNFLCLSRGVTACCSFIFIG